MQPPGPKGLRHSGIEAGDIHWGRHGQPSKEHSAGVLPTQQRQQTGQPLGYPGSVSDEGLSTAELAAGSPETLPEEGMSQPEMRHATGVSDVEDREELLQELRRKAQAQAARREHWCNVCGRAFMLTLTEILQHKRSHISA